MSKTWIRATSAEGMEIAFQPDQVTLIEEVEPRSVIGTRGKACLVTFQSGSYSELLLPFEFLYEIVTRDQS